MCERSDLHYPASSMIVFRFALLHTVLARRHPFEIIREPFLDSGDVACRQRSRILQNLDRTSDLHQMNCIDDPDTSTCSDALDGLGILQIWVHSSVLIFEPCPKMFGGLIRICF